ncbi:ethanolamine ammonia-lyase subunit EutC [Leptospira langatensis]|uniref:Ethanolamine ammonia-lyase small subunit n=1 Tax=Leptospira langatensis TaxID=2484983 RepID=A0A5F1ZQM9_9LEPT|nr:ethanolamine ammonia-lyase subunit EutC [Leptospira langatensis]TGK02800.1 ethanolamine ammonia-lyase subunit EutC [Leptospira langatensis]TGL39995.1 ethanolamine ammonia-lyase subunit EutC [Leptospira langatensis]
MISWEEWKALTSARIGLGRSGGSLPTKELLKFRLDHARARDAVLVEPDFPKLQVELGRFGKDLNMEAVTVESLARNREEYLLRPDLGRRLSEPSLRKLQALRGEYDLVIVAADGLSAKALDSNLIPFLAVLLPLLVYKKFRMGPFVLAKLGRVAIGDEIGEPLGARATVMLIGERPGLTSADSLGMYLTFDPKTGKTDESRNCISNIRPDGLVFRRAAEKTIYLLSESLRRGISGVDLKDEMSPDFLENPNTSEIQID